MTTVVVESRIHSTSEELTEVRLDLTGSTISRFYGQDMTFCYYHELDAETVFAGMKNKDNSIRVFVKLIHNEPVDLTIQEWKVQFARHSEFMPDD